MKRHLYFLPAFICLIFTQNALALDSYPKVVTENVKNYFPLVGNRNAAAILVDKADYGVVHIAASFLADDVERLTGLRPAVITDGTVPEGPAVIAGTVGKSALIDKLSGKGLIDVSALAGKWESYLVRTVTDGGRRLLVIAGSDPAAAKSIIKAEEGITVRNSSEGDIHTVKGLGFNDGDFTGHLQNYVFKVNF